MSYSNIIKLHRLQPQKVVVGKPVIDAKPAVQMAHQEDSINTSEAETANLADNTLVIAARSEAERILSKAHVEADALIEEANQKAEEIRLQAQEEGYHKGYEEALSAAKTGVLESIERISEMANNTAADMSCILNTLEEGVVDLALSIAEKVVHKRLAEDRSLILSMVEGALEYVDVMEVIRIRINPEDLGILRSHWEQGYINVSGRNIDLVSDPRVQLGGCIIDTTGSVVDAQIETKLAEIERAFRSELDGSAR